MDDYGSREICRSSILMALSKNREDEKAIKNKLLSSGIQSAAVDFGGEFIPSVNKIIERAIVAAKREGLIDETHTEEGAVAGAAREAVSQVMVKAVGLNVGGKIGIARYKEHISVALFFGIGILNLNEIAIGLGHRAI